MSWLLGDSWSNFWFNSKGEQSDGYMPQDERESVGEFWNSGQKNFSMFLSEIRKKYTFAIIPRDSKILEVVKNEGFVSREFVYYTIVELK